MKKSFAFILATLLVVSVIAIGIISAAEVGDNTNQTVNQVNTSNGTIAPVIAPAPEQNREQESEQANIGNTSNGSREAVQAREKERERVEFELEGRNITVNGMNLEQARELLQEKNRLRLQAMNGTSPLPPPNCTRAGSTLKCTLNGTRTMTVTAGKSGNVIVQVQGVNASTNVTLYKASDGKVYGIFGNQTQIVRMPDAIRERISERLQANIQNESMHLNQDGNYSVNVTKQVKFLGLFPALAQVQMKINAENGTILQQHNPWWAFLASNVKNNVVGASCGTVTPGQNDACCQAKGFDFWNATSAVCDFNSSD